MVTVFKSDDTYPKTLEKPFQVDVITCAAPYINLEKKKNITTEKVEMVLYNRMKNILEIAIDNDVDILVLGAWGCGAFNNNPEQVAEICYHLIVQKEYGKYFKKVVFAIKKTRENCPNLEAFRKKFE